MAHFAEIDQDGTVQRVIVFAGEGEAGEAACASLLGGVWKQTSYNATIRKNYAAIGMAYDAERDAFIAMKPFPSWTLDEQTCKWEAPIQRPDGEEGMPPLVWNEDTLSWVPIGGQG